MVDDHSGSVSRETVIKVLRAAADECGYSIKDVGKTLTLVKDGTPEVYDFPELIPRRMLGRLTGKYGVRREYFYHPEMCCGGNTTKH